MTSVYSTTTTKKLVLQFILENIHNRKRNEYLQEIVNMGKKNEFWMQALYNFFDAPYTIDSEAPIELN
jgi:hypothetical protein